MQQEEDEASGEAPAAQQGPSAEDVEMEMEQQKQLITQLRSMVQEKDQALEAKAKEVAVS